METDRAFAFPVVAHPAPAGDLLPLHQTCSCGDVAFQPRNGLLTPQCNGLHAGHIFPFLQVDPGNQTNYLFIPPPDLVGAINIYSKKLYSICKKMTAIFVEGLFM